MLRTFHWSRLERSYFDTHLKKKLGTNSASRQQNTVIMLMVNFMIAWTSFCLIKVSFEFKGRMVLLCQQFFMIANEIRKLEVGTHFMGTNNIGRKM